MINAECLSLKRLLNLTHFCDIIQHNNNVLDTSMKRIQFYEQYIGERTDPHSVSCHNFKCKNNKILIKFKKCSHCRIMIYCSRKCQKYDWSVGKHRLQCKKLKTFKYGH